MTTRELRIADEQQKGRRDVLTFDAWGGKLSLEQYLVREQRLRAHPWAAAGMTTWLLVDGDEVLASCETFKMQSALERWPADWERGRQWRHSLGIASVYTEAARRGQGHATELLRLLVEEVRRTDAKCEAIALYSDVGAPIYERVGFVARPAEDWVFAPEPINPAASAVVWISEKNLGKVFAPEGLLEPPLKGFVIWPTASQIGWHLERERIVANALGREALPYCGARAGSSHVLWTADHRAGSLKLLLLDANDAMDTGKVLQAARRVAHAAGLSEVRCWAHPISFDTAELRALKVVPREGSLPMLLALAEGVRAEDWLSIPRAIWV